MLIADASSIALLGPAAAIGTSILWTASSLLFTQAGRRLGATVVNAARIWIGLACVALTYSLATGMFAPSLHSMQVVWLCASGLVGICIGDQALLTSYVLIGPRLAALVTTSAPLMAALFGYALLGEQISWRAWPGMALTIGGIAWVISERAAPMNGFVPTRLGLGVTLALVSAACQAGGLLMSKKGLGHGWLPTAEHATPLAAAFVRLCAAAVAVVPLLLVQRMRERARPQIAEYGNVGVVSAPQAWTHAALGGIIGPFGGMTLSLVAADRIPIGIAQTLCSLSPIFILPAVVVLYHEKVTMRATVGAVIAVAGAAWLLLSNTG